MKQISLFLALAIAFLVVADTSARPPRVTSRSATPQWTPAPSNTYPSGSATTDIVTISNSSPAGAAIAANPSGAQEALDEVNATRAARGLPPYVRDPGLTQAAMTIAMQRAARLTQGHTANDFAGVPAGTTASASGCAAWPASMGWGSCCTYDRYTYAGAAWAIGNDGRRYMQLFVR